MKISFLLLSLFLVLPSFAQDFSINKSVYNGSQLEQLSHSGSGRWDTYLTMNLSLEPVAELFKQLLIYKRNQLANRGEAHITVITPIEFWEKLKPAGVTIEEINEIATNYQIQKSTFKITCLAESTATINDKKLYTYYMVVKSEDLIDIRKEVQKTFIKKAKKKGIDFSSFDPLDYHPHITLGFSQRDLHQSDGIIKDGRDCLWSVREL